jgi:mRNA deadenylase 3'-5' endonuclease subunit Ccr4
LRVITYNVLAQTYFQQNARQQATCPPALRKQPARHRLLMAELDELMAATEHSDGERQEEEAEAEAAEAETEEEEEEAEAAAVVLCLQEVEGSYLEALLRPALEARGYSVRYLQKVEGGAARTTATPTGGGGGGGGGAHSWRRVEGVALCWRG